MNINLQPSFLNVINQSSDMSKIASVNLGEQFNGFIAQQIQTGHYATASEVLCAGLQLLQEQQKQEAKLSALRAALIKGEQSGTADYNLQDFIARLDGQDTQVTNV